MKKFLSLLLVMIMIISSVPVTSFASNWLCELTGNHTLEWVETKAATCKEPGVKIQKCTRSGCDYGINETTEQLPHIDADVNLICDLCGTKAVTGSCGTSCNYVLYDDGLLVISGTGAIKESAFYKREDIKRVIIEKGITEICNFAFADSDIETIRIGDDVKYSRDTAFQNCHYLTDVYIGSGLKGIYEFGCSCGQLKNIIVDDSNLFLSDIDGVLFNKDQTLIIQYPIGKNETKYTVPASVLTIGKEAFDGAVNLKEITIPSSVEKIERNVFRFTELERIIVADGNDYYTSDEYGVLFDKNKTTLIKYPTANSRTEYSIPDTVVNLGASAFQGDRSLEKVKIPDGVKYIGEYCFFGSWKLDNVEVPYSVTQIELAAFKQCQSLNHIVLSAGITEISEGMFWATPIKSIVIPGTVKLIKRNAFEKCTKLSDVYFEGSEEAWKSISVEEKNEELLNANIHFFNADHSHKWSEWTVIKKSTCFEMGIEEANCTVCGQKWTKTIDVLPHVEEVIKAKEPTCTEYGATEEVICAVCKLVIVKAVPIEPFGHKMDEFTISKQPTCTEKGSKSGYCTICKKTVVEDIPATGHKVDNPLLWQVTVAATCTKEGVKVATCSVCGDEAKEIVPATGHQEVIYTYTKAPTCTTEGATESWQCSVCKTITVKAEKIPKLEHKSGEWIVKKAATCAVAGVEESECTVCGENLVRSIDRLPHTEKANPGVEATCTKSGSTEEVVCAVCSTYIIKRETIDALGHDYVIDKETYKEPTCTQSGALYGVCSRCGYVKDEVMPALGHKEEIYPGTPADCTLSGVTDGRRCKVCGEVTVEPQVTPPLGHDFILDKEKTKPATCTENGYEYLYCSRCSVTEERVAPALGHSWSEWKVTIEPTCDKQGEKVRKCSSCGMIDTVMVDSLGGHNVITLPGIGPTCTTAGLTSGSYCSKCNMIFEMQIVIPASGHNIKEDPGRAPTCTDNGWTSGSHCSICGEIFEVQDIIPALGHDIEDVEPVLEPATFSRNGRYALYCRACDEAVDYYTIRRINKNSIRLSTEKCTYNGKTRTPSVYVEDMDGMVLEKDVDYTVKYDRGRKNPGQYNIEVVFKGNYSGSKNLVFTIAPGKTSQITATPTQYGGVDLSWDEVPGATGYRVYVYEYYEDSDEYRRRVASVTDTSYYLDEDYYGYSLDMGYPYKIAVAAYTKLEDGTVIHSLEDTEKVFTCSPGKPELTVKSAGGKAILEWTSEYGNVAYQVWYSTDAETYQKILNLNDDYYITNSLTSGQTYYFKVRAYSTDIYGDYIYSPFSDVKSVKIVGSTNNGNTGNTSDPADSCDCWCHGNAFQRLLFKFGYFFQKLFGKNQVCACGIKHR